MVSKNVAIEQLTHNQRLAILVVPDALPTEDSAKIGGVIAGGVVGALFGPLGIAVGAGLGAFLQSSDDADGITRVGISEARAKLTFPCGHPKVNVGYGRHPHNLNHYLPLDDYHSMLLESKHRELMKLLAALGATRVRVVSQAVRSQGVSASASANLPMLNAAGGWESTRASQRQVSFDECYEPSAFHEPHVPSGLTWFAHEPAWQGLAERRIRHRLDDYGISAELIARYKVVGGSGAAATSKIEYSVWEFEAVFPTSQEAPTHAALPTRVLASANGFRGIAVLLLCAAIGATIYLLRR